MKGLNQIPENLRPYIGIFLNLFQRRSSIWIPSLVTLKVDIRLGKLGFYTGSIQSIHIDKMTMNHWNQGAGGGGGKEGKN